MIRRLVPSLAVALLLAGCPEEEETPAPQEATQTEEPETTPVEQAEAEEEVPSAEDVPIPEDFADEAEQQITEENYEAELDRLAAEIEADIEGSGTDEGG